jgi:hypothetical protein
VSKLLSKVGISAAAFALAAFAYAAQAQQKAPDKGAPKAAAQPKCNTIKQQGGCEGRTDCSWVAESKDAKGKVKKAYCRAKPKEAPQKAAPKKEAPKK